MHPPFREASMTISCRTSAARGWAIASLATALGIFAPAVAGGVEDWVGVYKTKFDNAMVSGEKFLSENVIEIVKVGSDAAYVRVHLEFYNAHTCDLWVVASADADQLVYQAPHGTKTMGDGCTLTITRDDGTLTLHDADGACRNYSCGVRGSIDGASFPLRAKGTIHRVRRIKRSYEYKEAVAEWKNGPSILPRASPVARGNP